MATASDTGKTSICQIDRALPFELAPAASVDDPGNKLDTDKTAEAIMEHNARYRAACPQGD